MYWDPLKDILNIHEKMNRIFQDNLQSDLNGHEWQPPVDIYETPTQLIIIAEVPGVMEESIDVKVKDNILTLQGVKAAPAVDTSSSNYYRMERSFGRFRRAFSLPANILVSEIDAHLVDGVLTISLNKNLDQRVTQVKVTKK